MTAAWLTRLKKHRSVRALSQREVATRSGLSLSAVKSYESGRRQPSRDALCCLIDAVGIPREEANLILADAGYAVESSTILTGRLAPLSEAAISEELAATPWPAFVTNQAFDVLYANRAIEQTLGTSLDAWDGPVERNLLSRMTDAEFALRLRNWDEVMLLMIGLAKGDPRRKQSLDHPIPWLEAPVRRLMQGDPALVARVLQTWQGAPPVEHRLRHRYRVVWEASPETVLTFVATFMPVDVWAELHWNEWVPADRVTWEWLARRVS